jgi:hypothetical protein
VKPFVQKFMLQSEFSSIWSSTPDIMSTYSFCGIILNSVLQVPVSYAMFPDHHMGFSKCCCYHSCRCVACFYETISCSMCKCIYPEQHDVLSVTKIWDFPFAISCDFSAYGTSCSDLYFTISVVKFLVQHSASSWGSCRCGFEPLL